MSKTFYKLILILSLSFSMFEFILIQNYKAINDALNKSIDACVGITYKRIEK